LIGRGLIDRTDAEIDNRSAHSSTLPVWQRKDAMQRTDNQSIFDTPVIGDQKLLLLLAFGNAFSRRFFRTPCGSRRCLPPSPHPLRSTNPL
jgi:hypothetical protein